MVKKLTYIFDIDNTICTQEKEYVDAQPIPEHITKVNKKFDEGHTIIFWTSRGSTTGIDWTELTKKQLKKWGVKYTELWMKKPPYDYWVDDKGRQPYDFFKYY